VRTNGGRGDAYCQRWSCGARLPLAESGRALGLVWFDTSNRIPDIDPGVRRCGGEVVAELKSIGDRDLKTDQ
jgi:hypothetical protein